MNSENGSKMRRLATHSHTSSLQGRSPLNACTANRTTTNLNIQVRGGKQRTRQNRRNAESEEQNSRERRRSSKQRAKQSKASRAMYYRLKGPGTESQRQTRKNYPTHGEGTEHFEFTKTRWKTERGGYSTEHVLARCGSLKQ